MSTAHYQIKLAKKLPAQLLSFFKRYPPPPNLSLSPAPLIQWPAETTTDGGAPAHLRGSYLNPFLPHKHPVSGRWRKSLYSLRRQADLAKLAQKHGVEELLPYTPKRPDIKLQKRVDFGLRVKGTGVGQKVKGHKWERTLKPKLEKRREAMLNMPKLVQEWKLRGHGKGWKKWPK